jgi:hypothetical protein
MIGTASETVSIDRAGLEEILRLHVERTETIDRSKTRVTFDVQDVPMGHGMSEHTVTTFRSAQVETTTPTPTHDVLKVLGRRTFRLDEDETKAAILLYVSTARAVPEDAVSVELRLEGRHQGDRGGWEGPGVTGAVASIKLERGTKP